MVRNAELLLVVTQTFFDILNHHRTFPRYSQTIPFIITASDNHLTQSEMNKNNDTRNKLWISRKSFKKKT